MNQTNPNRPEYPQALFDRQVKNLLPLAKTDAERDALRTVLRLTLPDSNIKALARASTILFVSGSINRDTYRSFFRLASRNLNHKGLAEPESLKRYPYFYAIRRLYERGRNYSRDGIHAIRLLVQLGAVWPARSRFSAAMYYEHAKAYRKACLFYWQSAANLENRQHSDEQSFSDRFKMFINKQLRSKSLTKARHEHLILTKGLLDGTLVLGGAVPRAKVRGRRRHDIDSEISPSPDLLKSIENTTTLNSARVDEQWLDDEGVHARIDYPERSTARDRHRIDGHVQNGFARTNVRTTADMSSCSLVTHRGFLQHAYNDLDGAAYALTWLVAFTGIDFRRPIRTQINSDAVPENDEILVNLADSSIQYKVLRRYERDDPSKYKSCGIFRLPVPNCIASGLDEIASLGSQPSSVDAAQKLASKYSRSNTGLTPTPTRLRSGCRTHFAPLGLTELEFAVVSGRVPPAVKAISAYYSHSSARIAEKFSTTYKIAFKTWSLPKAIEYDCPLPARRRRDAVLCKPDDGSDALNNMLQSIARKYRATYVHVRDHIGRIDIDQLIAAVNLHELGCYSLQELGVGLRPTGEVAKFAAVNYTLGGMTVDKSSRLFSERSYSPITTRHWQLLRACRQNRTELLKQLRYVGKKLKMEEPGSDLAIEIEKTTDTSKLKGTHLTGSNFRKSLAMVPGVLEIPQKPNWLRRRAANHIGGKVPQWQADEFLGHRRVGREPLGRWSTAGPANFQDIRQHLADLHRQIIPDGLLVPVFGDGLIERNSQDET